MQTKRRPKLSKVKLINLYFWFATVLAAASFVALALAYQYSQRAYTMPPSSFRGVALGKTASTDRVEVTIISSKTSAGTSHFTAPRDKKFAIIKLLVKNTGTKPITVLPSADSYLKATSGTVSYLTPYELEMPFRSGTLLPGEAVQGELSYLIDTKQHYKLYLESDWTGGVMSFLLD